jgi:hypothetical protein
VTTLLRDFWVTSPSDPLFLVPHEKNERSLSMEVRRSPSSRSTQQRELLASWHGFFRPRPPADAEQECKTRSTIDEVLLANLMQRMEDRGEVFEHVAEYCVYLVLVYERTDGSRALVGAYVGSAGRRGQSYLCAYEHRAGIATDPS